MSDLLLTDRAFCHLSMLIRDRQYYKFHILFLIPTSIIIFLNLLQSKIVLQQYFVMFKTSLTSSLDILYPFIKVSKLSFELTRLMKWLYFIQDRLQCTCAKRLSQLTEKQSELMRKKLPQKKPIKGVNHIILVASGKGGVGKSTTAGKLVYSNV